MFHVGQKVVCIDDTNFTHKNVGDTVMAGRIYVIRGFDRYVRKSVRGIYLNGVYCRARRGGRGNGEELSWKPYRFKPLTERKTDISVFERIRDGVTRKIKETA